jgi:hypothetical protein
MRAELENRRCALRQAQDKSGRAAILTGPVNIPRCVGRCQPAMEAQGTSTNRGTI